MKKYELTAESIVMLGRTLFRIKALVAFGDVKEGEFGGFVEKDENLDQSGGAWVSGDAMVFGGARVFGDAMVSGDARVFGDARVSGDARVFGDAQIFKMSHYLVVGPLGSRDDFTTFFRTKHLAIGIKCGCFKGDIDQFFEAVEKTHGNNKHARAYKAAIALAKLQIDLNEYPL